MFYHIDGRVECEQYTVTPTWCGRHGRGYYNETFAVSSRESIGVDPDPVVVSPEPVTLQEVKDQLHISFNDDDQWLTDEIKACRQSLEKFTGLSLVPKTITWHGSNVMGYTELPYGPVVAITDFTDSEDVDILPANYTTQGLDFVSIVSPAGSLKVTYTAGYTAANIPAELKNEIKRMVCWAYEHRGDGTNQYNYSNRARAYRRVGVIL